MRSTTGSTIVAWQSTKSLLSDIGRQTFQLIHPFSTKATTTSHISTPDPPPPLFSDAAQEHVSEDFVPKRPHLYQVGLGMGYLELPQVELPQGRMTRALLVSKHVYVLDCFGDVFVW